MGFTPKDNYFYKAKKQGYRARSAFKLQLIQEKYEILKEGDRVLDLGAAPGGWMQVALEYVGNKGKVVGVDLQPIESLNNKQAIEIVGDVTDFDIQKALMEYAPYNAIVSDMAPKTSGMKLADQARSLELVEMAFGIADEMLEKSGSVVAKVFESPEIQMLRKDLHKKFQRVELFKPKASRKESFETYFVAIGKR